MFLSPPPSLNDRIFYRKKGGYVWYATGYVNGKHFMRSTGTSDKKLAMGVLQRIEEDAVRMEEGLEPVQKIDQILLSEFIGIYLAARKKIAFRKTKTEKDRTIPISLELMQVLIALDRSKPKPFDYAPGSVSRLFKFYPRKAGLRNDFHLHCLRHTTASDLVRNGKHLKQMAEFLGHGTRKQLKYTPTFFLRV